MNPNDSNTQPNPSLHDADMQEVAGGIDFYVNVYTCPICNHVKRFFGGDVSNYCPNCNVPMIKTRERHDWIP